MPQHCCFKILSPVFFLEVTLWSWAHDVATGNLDYIDTNFFESYPGIAATIKGVKEQSFMKAYHDNHAGKVVENNSTY
jgi:hypothetical protein